MRAVYEEKKKKGKRWKWYKKGKDKWRIEKWKKAKKEERSNKREGKT